MPLQDDEETIEQCRELQKEEYQVIESIYPEFISSNTTDAILKLEIPIEFTEPTTCIISIPISESTAETEVTIVAKQAEPTVTLPTLQVLTPPQPPQPQPQPQPQTLSINVLPPLQFQLRLPPTYPLHAPPEIISLRTMHSWLPDGIAVAPVLVDMWQPGEGVLYTWLEFIRTGEFLNSCLKLSVVGESGKSIFNLNHPAPKVLAPLLTSYDESFKSNHFAQNSYPCSICLTFLKGAKCLQLTCGHIFCRGCLEEYWKLCIEEGDVGRVICPDPGCVKLKKEAVEEEVARVVTEQELKRWRWLRDKRDIEKDPTVVHCPVAVCQTPIPKPLDLDPEADSESSWNRLRQCHKCGFSFCAFCKRTWHGPLDKCPMARYAAVVEEYLTTEEGSEERLVFEKRFGRANLKRLVATYEEDKANLEWFKESTTACPGCQCHIEKTLGCNHMTCWKCGMHFCYKCGVRLNAEQPYRHFSTPGLGCYNQLFDRADIEDNNNLEWDLVGIEFEDD